MLDHIFSYQHVHNILVINTTFPDRPKYPISIIILLLLASTITYQNTYHIIAQVYNFVLNIA